MRSDRPAAVERDESPARRRSDGETDLVRDQRRAIENVRPAEADQSARQMRRLAPVIAAATAVVVLRVFVAAQEWRPAALQSFDVVWQTIHDTFVDPSFGGLDWDAVRAELRPKAEAATSENDVRRVLREMLSRLKQSHFQLLPSVAAADETVAGDAVLPFDVRVTREAGGDRSSDPRVMITRVDRAAISAGLHAGDLIVSINDARVDDWVKQLSAVGNTRTVDFELWKKAARAMYGPANAPAAVAIRTASTPRIVQVPQIREQGEVVTFGNLPPMHVRVTVSEERTASRRRIGLMGFNVWLTAIDQPIADR